MKVESLVYDVSSEPGISYRLAVPASSFSNSLGRFELTQGRLTFFPSEHFESAEAAKAAIQSFLRSWEIEASLRCGVDSILFEFNSANVVDLEPTPGVFQISGNATIHISGSGTLTVTRVAYPEPPSEFQVTSEVEYAFRRWRACVQGREPLLSFAYFLYTVLAPKGVRDRRTAAAVFAVDESVLRKLSELTSTRGSADEARKFAGASGGQPLSSSERTWLEDVAKVLLVRLGEHAAGKVLHRIEMTQLPPI